MFRWEQGAYHASDGEEATQLLQRIIIDAREGKAAAHKAMLESGRISCIWEQARRLTVNSTEQQSARALLCSGQVTVMKGMGEGGRWQILSHLPKPRP